MSSTDPGQLAAAKLSEALEYVERARGHLFSLHQLTGHADLLLDEALEELGKAGRDDLTELVRTRLYGRNVLPGRWTFQLVEEFDDGFYAQWRDVEQTFRDELTGGERHTYETRMKAARRAEGVDRDGAADD